MSAPYLFPINQNGSTIIREFFPETEPAWPELVTAFKTHYVQKPLLFNTPDNQLEPLFYLACKEIPAPAITTSIYNVPLAKVIMQTIHPDSFVIEHSISKQFFEVVSDHIAEETLLVVIFSTNNTIPLFDEAAQKKFSKADFVYLKHPLS